MSRFLDSEYNSLTPYDTSGEIESMNGYIRLNTNELPFAPSFAVRNAVYEASKGLNFYCDPDCRELAEKLSSMLNVKTSEIIFGNGSDEILNFIFAGFCENGAAFPNITYSFYKILAEFHHVDYITVPLKNFMISPDDYKDIKGRTIFIANPNAPTGIALELSEIEKIIAQNHDNLVVIDEAYIDFGGESAKDLIHKYDNLIVTRTFSKSRSMAGARLGFCLTNEELAKDIRSIKNTITPYNINAMTQAAGLAALNDEDYTQKNIKAVQNIRDDIKNKLRSIGFEVLDSSTNFLFVRHEFISGEEIFNALKSKKIMIRHFTKPAEISNFNRITIGNFEQMQKMFEVIKEAVKK